MMAMPYMLDQAGTISGVVMFVASMALTQLSIARVLDVDAALRPASAKGQQSARKPLLGANAETEEGATSLVRDMPCCQPCGSVQISQSALPLIII